MISGRPSDDGRSKERRLSKEEAQERYIQLTQKGWKHDDVMKAIGRGESAYAEWRRLDDHFRMRVDVARHTLSNKRVKGGEISFPDFCAKYLFQPLSWHQLQWVDLLEGRTPRDLHESETYEPGDPNFLLVNTPPEHAKTQTLSVNWATYQVCMNPNVRIIFVSKTAEFAKQILYAVKQRLTHVKYVDLQAAYAPQGGWKQDAQMWGAGKVYLGSERDSGEKDPTMQAIGIGGQIYGQRTDLIIVDDAVVLSNAHEYEKQIRWLQQEVITRGGDMGRLFVIGTRVDPIDMYSELRNPERYPDGGSPWTYLAQPAVLEFADDPKEWKTLWPRAFEPWPGATVAPDRDGMYPKWDGTRLKRRRGQLARKTWALAYMQASVSEDSVFPEEVVRKCVNNRRQPGLMVPGAPGHRPEGMEGLYVIGSMDPAMVGDTGVIVMGVDRHQKKRFILEVLKQPHATPGWIKQTIKDLTEKYKIHEWRIEKNAFQAYLTQDETLREHLDGLGVRLSEHHTGKNKWDVDFGVASLATVLEAGLIELPATHVVEAAKALVEQFITWAPETKNKTDLVMATWFAEIRAREIINTGGSKNSANYLPNRFATRRSRSQQVVLNLNDLAIAARG